jgi:predicted amidohydrolase
MKICVAQINPAKGDIQKNIDKHKQFINRAICHKADFIVFPELSLTGYEPTLAKSLAINKDDKQLDELQIICNTGKISIGVGLPTKSDQGICISMIIFQPNQSRKIYSKQFLHPGEEIYFTNGHEQLFLTINNHKIAPAICYELSVSAHSAHANDNGVNIYMASVCDTIKGVDKDLAKLSDLANTYQMIVVMSNFVGQTGGYDCGGKSSVWNEQGELLGQLDNVNEGILIFDTDTNEIKNV